MREVGLEQKSLCTWDKGTAGMGAHFRNVAEQIIVSKSGTAPHIDNVQLGRHGRNRSTIWRVPGYAGFGRDRAEALERHATCKPVALIADALLDFSHVGHVVYDAFIGSGTTLVAAHRTRRCCYGVELDGRFVDAAVGRMEAQVGAPARHAESGLTFASVAAQRAAPSEPPAPRVRRRLSAPGTATDLPRRAPATRRPKGRARDGRRATREARARATARRAPLQEGPVRQPQGSAAQGGTRVRGGRGRRHPRAHQANASAGAERGSVREIPYLEALVNQLASAGLKTPRDGFRMLRFLMADGSGALPRGAIPDDEAGELLDDPIVKRQVEREVRRRLQQQGQHGAAAALMRDQFGPTDETEGHDGGEDAGDGGVDHGNAGDEGAGDDGPGGGA